MTDIAVEKHSIWQELRDAIRGTDTDFTEAPLRRAVVLLAVPMMLEMVLESLFAVVNIFWVGKLGPAATASVGLTESLLSVVYALAMGLSIGVTALVARRIGEKHTEQAARTTGQAILLGLIVVLAFSSYDESRNGAEREAQIVAQQYQTAQFLGQPGGADLAAELVCYGRYVVHREWPHMEEGDEGEAANPWGIAMFETLRGVEPELACRSPFQSFLRSVASR